MVERSRRGRREFEPREEIEWLSRLQIAAMIQSARDGGQIPGAEGDMRGLLLEDAPPLVLRKIPPSLRFPDGDQRRVGRFPSAYLGLGGRETLFLFTRRIPLVAPRPTKNPLGRMAGCPLVGRNYAEAFDRREGISGDGALAGNAPRAPFAAGENEAARIPQKRNKTSP